MEALEGLDPSSYHGGMGREATASRGRPPLERAVESAAIALTGLNIWVDERRAFSTPDLSLPSSAQRELLEAVKARRPIWVELEVLKGWPDWYRSWEKFDRSTVQWDRVDRLLGCLGIERPDRCAAGSGHLSTEVLRVLPFVYELGATRAFAEIEGRRKYKRVRAFPASGFEVSEDPTSGFRSFSFRPVAATAVGRVAGRDALGAAVAVGGVRHADTCTSAAGTREPPSATSRGATSTLVRHTSTRLGNHGGATEWRWESACGEKRHRKLNGTSVDSRAIIRSPARRLAGSSPT